MPRLPQNPHPNDPWASTGREAYSHGERYVDPRARAKKSDSGIFGKIIRWILFFAMLVYAYHYFTSHLQP